MNAGSVADETDRFSDRYRDDAPAICDRARNGPAIMEEGDVMLALMFLAYLAGCVLAVWIVEKWERQ